jgi:hypothetical protein
MPFTQTQFFGLSIINFSSNVGWGDSPSTLNVTLVQDTSNGDVLIPPTLGMPATFTYGSFVFGGIVRSFNRDDSFSGSPLYSMILEDPREILSGVTLILSNYNGTVSVPNVLNIYGYLENTNGFGSSRASTSGMPSYLIKNAITELTSGMSPNYGGYILLGNYQFRIDLSELPTLPDYYRVTSPNMSVLDFIREICDATNHEYFFKSTSINGINYIYLRTINRNEEPNLGSIAAFVAGTPGAISKSVGFEFRNEVTSKFLIGGNTSRMYGIEKYDTNADGDDAVTPEEDVTIWPFWGTQNQTDIVDNLSVGADLIFGRGDLYNGHTFTVDCRSLKTDLLTNNYFRDHIGIFDTYTMDIGELRAARYSQESWESYLWFHNNNRFRLYDTDYVEGGNPGIGKEADHAIEISYEERTDRFNIYGDHVGFETEPAKWGSTIIRYFANKRIGRNSTFTQQFPLRSEWGIPNPHFGKAKRLGLVGGIVTQDVALFLGSITDDDLKGLRSDSLSSMTNFDHKAGDESNIHEENISRIYNFVKKYADEYYGRKWMVKVPAISAYRDVETQEVIYSHQPEETGFIDESEWENAIRDNLLPFDVNRLTDNDGRIFVYVKFPKYLTLDVTQRVRAASSSGHSITGLYTYTTGSGLNVKYFLNVYYLFNDIPDEDKIDNEVYDSIFIKCEIDPTIYFEDVATQFGPRVVITMPGIVKLKLKDMDDVGILKDFLKYEYSTRSSDANDVLPPEEGIRDEIITNIISSFGSDMFRFGSDGLCHPPQFAAIPLKSNVNTYGPWYATGINGRTEFEQDDTLVPWNYAGFTGMNNAANAKVSSSISLYNVSEAGQIETPDTPSLSLGDQLIGSGPYVTDINVSIDADGGAKTSYGLATWTPHPYRQRKFQSDYISRLSKTNQQLRRNFREKLRQPPQASNLTQLRRDTIVGLRRKPRSTHFTIGGEVTIDSNGFTKSMVGLQPVYNSVTQFYNSGTYEQKALVSLDNLFVPYSTNPNARIAHFERPSESGELNIDSYNPFRSGIVTSIITHGQRFPDSISTAQSSGIDFENIRSIALKSPLILAGWGYDTDDKPVPNSGVIATSGTATDDFHQDYLRRQDLWKVGPLDTRWDDERKVWVAGSSSQKLVQILDAIPRNVPYPSSLINKQNGIVFYSGDHVYPISTTYLGYTTFNYTEDEEVKRGYRAGAVYFVREINLYHSGVIGSRVELRPSSKFDVAANFRPSLVEPSSIWTANKIDGIFVLDNQTTLLDFNISTSVV